MKAVLTMFISALTLTACAAEPSAEATATGDWPAFVATAPAPAAEPAALPRACDLVTLAQAQAILGDGASPMSDDPEACLFAAGGQVGELAMLTVTVLDNDDEAMAQTVFNSLAGTPSTLGDVVNRPLDEKTRKSAQELEGLGDEAAVSSSSFGGAFGAHQTTGYLLVVRKGRRILGINLTGTRPTDGASRRLQALARDAVDKL